jgi:hypothetical protein
MHLNALNPKTVRTIGDQELQNLHFRLHQLASPYLRDNAFQNPKFQSIVLRHRLIAFEIIRRGLRFKVHDELDRKALPEIETFIERFSKLIPGKLPDLSKLELIRLHNQLHSTWEVIHAQQVTTSQQEQLWNWHRMLERELERRDMEPPKDWDSLDRPLGRAISSLSRTQASGQEMGEWLFIEDLLPLIPEILPIKKGIVLIDSEKGKVYLSDVGGRQLIKVMYFRILRQFPRQEWSRFTTVGINELGSIDVSYDLVLRKLDPLWTVQLSFNFDDLCLVKPFLYIVGGVATQGASKNDIDILLRQGLEEDFEQQIYLKFISAFPEKYRSRFTRVDDSGLSPFTSYIGVYSLELVKGDPSQIDDEEDQEQKEPMKEEEELDEE